MTNLYVRLALTFGFTVVLIMAIFNTYFYLFKQKMYKSAPLVMMYIITFAFSIINIIYEVTMISCDKKVCFFPDRAVHDRIEVPPED